MILSEPDFPYREALAPYQPLSIKVVHCPIDTCLTFVQANKIVLQELKPSNLLLPKSYIEHRPDPDLSIDDSKDCQIFTFERGDVVELSVKCKYEKLYMDTELCNQITPVPFNEETHLATVTGILETKDNNFKLLPITKSFQMDMLSHCPTKTLPMSHYKWGQVDLLKLASLMRQAGIDATIDQSNPDRVLIDVVSFSSCC